MPTPTGSKGPTQSPTARGRTPLSAVNGNGRGTFVVPVLHVSVPESVVNAGFWGALVGAAALGAVELPLAALIGAGVVVARHRRSH